MITVALGDVCQITMGQAPAGESYNSENIGLPLVAGAGDFSPEGIRTKKFTAAATKVCAPGDIILSIRASIGAKVWADSTYCLGRGVAGLRAGSGLDSRYLWHWLSRNEPALLAKGRGATFLQVNRADLADLPLVLPPLDEQRRIAAILDHAAVIVSSQVEQLALLDLLQDSLLVDLFGSPAGWAALWPMGSIGDLCESFDYGTSKKSTDTGGLAVLRMGNITFRGRLDLTKLKYTELPSSVIERYTVRRGDLLFNRTNSPDLVGKTAVVDIDTPMAYAGYLIRVRMKPGHRAEFVSGYLNSLRGKTVLRGLAKSAVSQANINAQELRAIRIAMPPKELQDEYASRIEALRRQRDVLTGRLDEARRLADSLARQAFAGQL